jgi:hypothetical protein
MVVGAGLTDQPSLPLNLDQVCIIYDTPSKCWVPKKSFIAWNTRQIVHPLQSSTPDERTSATECRPKQMMHLMSGFERLTPMWGGCLLNRMPLVIAEMIYQALKQGQRCGLERPNIGTVPFPQERTQKGMALGFE